MARTTITRLAAGAVVTGIATLALAAPASTAFPKDPDAMSGTAPGSTPPPVVSDSEWEWYEVATGALGGIALAGIGVGAAAGLRRHNHQVAHPA